MYKTSNSYSMFTSEGNMRVHKLIMVARREGWDWDKMVRHLGLLSKCPGFSEANSNHVRNAVKELIYD